MVLFEDLKILFNNVFPDPANINEKSTYLDVEGWDSMAHIDLMISIQNKFNVMIPDEQIPRLNSIDAIMEFLNNGSTQI